MVLLHEKGTWFLSVMQSESIKEEQVLSMVSRNTKLSEAVQYLQQFLAVHIEELLRLLLNGI